VIGELRKSGYILIFVLLVFVGSITYILHANYRKIAANALTINELRYRITELENENSDLRKELEAQAEAHEREHELFQSMAFLSKEFVDACVSGNKEVLTKLLSDEFTLKDNEREIMAVYKYENENISERLYSRDSEYIYKDMLIQGYNYDVENDIFYIFLREFYVDKHGKPADILPSYKHLGFKRLNDEWKIVILEHDV